MAALYLHNALYAPDPSSSTGTTPLSHNRNTSTVSSVTSVTLYTSTSDSHPTDSLLRAETSEAVAYRDLLSRQPTFVAARRVADYSVTASPVTPRLEKTRLWHARRRLNWIKLIRGSLGILLGAWTIYNTVRYFLAFTMYDSTDGQAVSLAMGISTGSSFALQVCAAILLIFQPYLLHHGVPLRTLLFGRTSIHAFSSFLLFVPTVYNLVMTSIWRSSESYELNFQHRCHIDIDVIWSVSRSHCKGGTWGPWMALSVIRLVLTLVIIIAYHMISERIGRPMYSTHRYNYRHRSQLSESQSSIPPSLTAYDFPVLPSHLPHHQPSDSTISSNMQSKHSSSHHSHRALYPHASMSTLYTDEDDIPYAEVNEPSQDQELNSFADRFRTLVSQITRETEVAVEFARPDSTLDDENIDFPRPSLMPAIGYDEFGQPYRPEEHVSFLNGYIRRMPTIESMGSREVGSSTTSKGMTTSRRSTATFSQPPTRANTIILSEHSSDSPVPSRGNSFTIYGEQTTGLGRTNEMGELVDKGGEDAPKIGVLTTSDHTTSTSTSYYTATSLASAGPAVSADRNAIGPPPGLDVTV